MMQRNKAKHRGIPWEFTFDTWWAMWKPYWEFRGNRRGLLVMARRGDYGAYSPSNCVIVSDHINRMHLI